MDGWIDRVEDVHVSVRGVVVVRCLSASANERASMAAFIQCVELQIGASVVILYISR